MKIAELIKYSCQNNNQKNKRASLSSDINWAKDNEKAYDRTIMKAAKMINKIMLTWIFNRPMERQWRYTIQPATRCFSREKYPLQAGVHVVIPSQHYNKCS